MSQGKRIIAWARPYPAGALRGDLTAGLTVAVLLVPQALAYATLAGMPAVTGLYTTVAASVVYAALGTSRQLGVGPVALTALLVSAGLAAVAEPGDPRRALLGPLLALLVGLVQLGMRALRLAGLANFLSHSVLAGFTAAAAIVIAATQVKDLLGVAAPSAGQSLVDTLRVLLPRLSETNPASALVGALSLAALLLGRAVLRGLPVPLLVMIGGASLSAWLGLGPTYGVAVLGAVPTGFPSPSVPTLDPAAVFTLLPAALAVAVVSFMESISQSRTIAARTRQAVDPGQELLAMGGMNLAAALFGGFPAGASFSRTALNLQAGARTQLAGLVAASVVLLVVQLFTPLLYPLPRAVLAAIVIVAVLGLIDLREMQVTWRIRHVDGLAVVVTFLATLVLGVGPGIAAGVFFSLVAFVYRSANPRIVELGRVEGTPHLFRDARRFAGAVRGDPRVVILRMDAPLYFANARFLADRVARLLLERPTLQHVLLDASAMADVDADGARTLHSLYVQLHQAGVALHLITLRGYVRDVMGRAGLFQTLLDDDRYWSDLSEALDALDLPADSALRFRHAEERRPERVF